MKLIHLITGGLLATLLAGGAAAQFNTEALKKMQQEGHKIVEEQQAAETPKSPKKTKAAGSQKNQKAASAARHAYRVGADLCLDARKGLSVATCNGKSASQQWALDARGRLVAQDGRCVDGASLVECAGSKTQLWVHDKRGRLRNQARQCLQPRREKPGAAVTAAACAGVPAQVWVEVTPAA